MISDVNAEYSPRSGWLKTEQTEQSESSQRAERSGESLTQMIELGCRGSKKATADVTTATPTVG